MSSLIDPIPLNSWIVKEEIIGDVEPRGGASIIEILTKIIIFGGADRNGQHFNDCIVKSSPGGSWNKIEMTGDIPTPRSGHAVVGYGKYMILFGGIDFSEEIDYNDLYILNTETWDWKYIGESGVEVTGRNSHSLCILFTIQDMTKLSYLVLYGGASGENGALGDTIYAQLPLEESIDMVSIFVEWKQLTGLSPGPREMHSTSFSGDKMFIIGGRDVNGQLLSDVWQLSLFSSTLRWLQRNDLRLPVGRCSHGSCMITFNPSSPILCIYGGFTALNTIDDKILMCHFTSSTPIWSEMPLSKTLVRKFGLAICSSTYHSSVATNTTIDTNTNNDNDNDDDNKFPTSLVVFGGVNAEMDFNHVMIVSKI